MRTDDRETGNYPSPIEAMSRDCGDGGGSQSYKMQHMQFDIQYTIMARASLLASAFTILHSCYFRPSLLGVLQNSMLCYAVSSFIFLPHVYCIP